MGANDGPEYDEKEDQHHYLEALEHGDLETKKVLEILQEETKG